MASDFLPLPEASIELGQSISTLRRRIKRGDVEYKRLSTPQGYQYWVKVDRLDHADHSNGQPFEPERQDLVKPVSIQKNEREFWMGLVRRLQKELDYERRRPRSFLAHILDFFRR